MSFSQKTSQTTFKITWTYPPGFCSVMFCVLTSSISVCLQDSVLAFWRHGMQGRSFRSNEVIITQSESRNLLLCYCVIMSFFFIFADYSRDQWRQQDVPPVGFRQVRPVCSLSFQQSVSKSVSSPLCLSAGWWFWRAERPITRVNTVTCTYSLDTKIATKSRTIQSKPV